MDMKPTDKIVQSHAAVLHLKAKSILKKDIGSPEIQKLISTMRKLLAAEKNGVGLAAPQVGVPIALFIVAGRVFEEEESKPKDNTPREDKALPPSHTATDGRSKESPVAAEPHPRDRVFINPELVRTSRKKAEMSEGCLSVRDVYGTVLRHEKASVRALNENGLPITINGTGLLAHIFQHEMDHLGGILFIDKAVRLDNEKKS